MSDNKKYYYLKLKDNFYDSEQMIILQNMQDGYLYSDILMKLYLRSVKTEGKLMFNNMIPYTPQVLAQVVRHQVGTVEKALKIFQELGLIEVLDNGAIYMLDIQNFIGKSSTEGDRKREYRARIKAEEEKKVLPEPVGQMSDQMSDKQPPEIDIEIEKEIDIELNNKLNEFNLYNNFDQNLQCECISKNTKKRCERRSTYNINGKNYCNQHSKNIINKHLGKGKSEAELDKVVNENIQDEEVKEAFYEFIKMRKVIKKPLTTRGVELAIEKLYKLSDIKEEQIMILNKSIMNNWQGLFPLKEEDKKILQKPKEYKESKMTEEEYFKKLNYGGKKYG